MKDSFIGTKFSNRQPFKRRIGFGLLVLPHSGNRGARRQLDAERQDASQREDCREQRPWRRGNRRHTLKRWRGGAFLRPHCTLLPDSILGELPVTNRITLARRRSCRSPETVPNPYYGRKYR